MGFWFPSRQERLNRKLCTAVRSGDMKRVRILLDMGASPNAVDYAGHPALMIAVIEKKQDIALYLIAKKARVNARNKVGAATLHYAAAYGMDYLVQRLIEAKADMNLRDHDQQTPLHYAADCGQFAAARVLLENGADASLRDGTGDTAEDLARQSNFGGLAHFIRKAGVVTGWHKTGPEEVSHVENKTGLNYRLTEIFNFTRRECTKIARNLETDAETQVVKSFDEITDKRMLETAYVELTRRGGRVDKKTIHRPLAP